MQVQRWDLSSVRFWGSRTRLAHGVCGGVSDPVWDKWNPPPPDWAAEFPGFLLWF